MVSESVAPGFDTTKAPGKHGFNIPEFLQDLFNKIFRKEQTFYTRAQNPQLMIPEYKTYSYRGVPVEKMVRLTLKYDDPVLPVEIYTIHRWGDEGSVLKITKVITDKSLESVGIVEPPNQ